MKVALTPYGVPYVELEADDPRDVPLLGHWINTDKDTRGVIGVSFTMTRKGEFRCAQYGKCHPSWSVTVFDVTPIAKGCWAKQNSKFKIEYTSFTIGKDGSLQRDCEAVFNDARGTMKKKSETFRHFQGDLAALGELMTERFYPDEQGGWNETQVRTLLQDFQKIPKSTKPGTQWTKATLMKLSILIGTASIAAWGGILSGDYLGSMRWITKKPDEYIMWVLAVVNLVAVISMPDMIAGLGHDLRESYMAVSSKSLPFGSGSVGIQVGGVLHRLGGLVTFTLVLMCTFAGVASVTMNYNLWKGDLDGQSHTVALDESQPLARLAGEANALCDRAGFTPMPFTYLLMKLVCMGAMQDIVFLSKKNKSLYEALKDPLSPSAIFFTALQTVSVMAVYMHVVEMVIRNELGGSIWVQYCGLLYYVCQQSGIISVFQLLAKMFIETNVEIDGTPPELYNAIPFGAASVAETKYGIPKIGSSAKANIFWFSAFSILPVLAPTFLTHIPIAMAYVVGAVSFPLWGSLLMLATSLMPQHSPAASWIRVAVETGRGAHLQVWAYAAIMIVLVLVAMHARAWLWSLQACLRRSPPNGKCGYMTSITTIFFTAIVIVLMQSFVAWAALMYIGEDLAIIPIEEFNSRQLRSYDRCLIDLNQVALTKVISYTGLV